MLLVWLLVAGTVTGVSSRWSGDVIVTEAVVRDDRGATVTVVQLGGSVDGLGMSFSHVPAVVARGDRVTIDPATHSIVAVAPAASFAAPAGGNATYGVQRTAKSGVPLWRASGCIELVYDATTIDAATAKIIDASFAAWSTGAASCGQIVATSTRRPNPPAARDEMSTVRIRTDEWCNPGDRLHAKVCYPKTAAAVTRLLFVDDPTDSEDGHILEADIELNGVDFVLLPPGMPVPATTKKVLDLQAVATHEAGHALGLAHNCGTGDEPWPSDHAGSAVPSCSDASPTVRDATMFYTVAPRDASARTLEPTDVAGICAVAQPLSCEPYVAGGCNASRETGALWLAVLAAVLALVSASSSSRCRAARSPHPSSSTRCPRALHPTAARSNRCRRQAPR